MPEADPRSRRVRLRPAEQQDADFVADVLITSRRAAETAGWIPRAVHSEPEVRMWVRDVVLPGRHVVLAEVSQPAPDRDEARVATDVGLEGRGWRLLGGVSGPPGGTLQLRVVGVLVLDASWVDQLYVLPEAQGHGIGAHLLQLAKKRRADGLQLWVFQSNAPAIGFYLHHGFVVVESTDGAANEERAPDHRMVWLGDEPAAIGQRLLSASANPGPAGPRVPRDTGERGADPPESANQGRDAAISGRIVAIAATELGGDVGCDGALHVDATVHCRSSRTGHMDVVTLGDFTVGRGVFEPGWKWSVEVGPMSGVDTCLARHTRCLHGRLDGGGQRRRH